MAWVFAAAALACFASMCVALLVGVRLARQLYEAETRYGGLLARYIVATEPKVIEVPRWVNRPGVTERREHDDTRTPA